MAVGTGEQRNAQQALMPAPLQRMIQQAAANTLAAMLFICNDIFEQTDKSALGGADSDEYAGHGNDLTVQARDE